MTIDYDPSYAGGGGPVDEVLRTYVPISGSASAGGDNTLITPAAGKTIRLYYLAVGSDGNNLIPTVFTLRLGAGAPLYTVPLVPGAIFARNIGAGRFYTSRLVNDALILNNSTGQVLYWSIEHDEV